jgi:3-phenylpropionate/trans-cinnamate dioxygenase ferredoxin reductase component
VLIGGGFIGLELAALARAMGTHVTLLESAPRLMGRAVPADIAAHAETSHKVAGIDIRLGAGTIRAGADGVALAIGKTLGADESVPVIGHAGLIPLRATWTGGFKAVGKTRETALLVWVQV